MKATVLVVEDEEKLRRVVELQLKTAGYEVEQAGTAEDALKLADRADVIITDLRLPGLSGLDMLQQLRGQNSLAPVIVMTAFSSIETAVEAMKAGAIDFLPKPFSLDHLMRVVNKALELRTLRDKNRQLKAELSNRLGVAPRCAKFSRLWSASPPHAPLSCYPAKVESVKKIRSRLVFEVAKPCRTLPAACPLAPRLNCESGWPPWSRTPAP